MKTKKLIISIFMIILLTLSVVFGIQNIAVASDDGEGTAPIATWGSDLVGENWDIGWASYYNNKDNNNFGNSLANAYEIKTAQELAIFAKLVREGNDFHGKYVRVVKDIDISSKQWVPIGSNPMSGGVEDTQMPFLGVFDAGIYNANGILKSNHIIKGLNISYLSSAVYGASRGLFAIVGSSNVYNCFATVKNLDLVGVYMDMHENPVKRAGAIAGLCSGLIENCNVLKDDDFAEPSIINNTDLIDTINITGGVVGYLRSGSLKNCTNEITVKSAGWTGGIAGRIAAESGTGELPSTDNRERIVINCINEGNITGRVVGGIGGYVGAGMSGVCYIVRCHNKGSIFSARNSNIDVTPSAGGILGFTSNQMHVIACINEGDVTASNSGTFNVSIGGIIGKGNAFIAGSYNYTLNIGVGVSGSYHTGALVGHALTVENPVVDNFVYVSYYLKNAGDNLNAVGLIGSSFSDMDKIYIAKKDADFYNGVNSFNDTPSYTRGGVKFDSKTWVNMLFNNENCWRFWEGVKPILICENVEYTVTINTSTYNGSYIIPNVFLHLPDGTDLNGQEAEENFSIKYYKKNALDLYVLMNAGEYPKDAGKYKVMYRYETLSDYGIFLKEFEVSKRIITVTPNALSKYYGDNDTDLTYNYDCAVSQADIDSGKGILENELGLLSGLITRTVGENVGSYAYRVGTLSAGNNYSIVLENFNNFTILKRPLNVSVKSSAITYGGTPTVTFDISNVVKNDKIILADPYYTVYHLGSPVVHYEAGNDYSIKITSLTLAGEDSSNYLLNINEITEGSLTVSKAELTITINNATKVYGEDKSTIYYSHSILGWKFSDAENANEIITDFKYTCSGEVFDAPLYDGDILIAYPIQCTYTNNSSNYLVKVIAGNLTIKKRTITINEINAVDKVYDGTNVAEVQATFSNILSADEEELIAFINNHLKQNAHMAYFDDANIGENKTVHLKINLPNSTLFKNYSISSGGSYTATALANIKPCPMKIIIDSVDNHQYGVLVNPITYRLEGVPTADINYVMGIISNNLKITHSVDQTASVGIYSISLQDRLNSSTQLDDDYFYNLFPNYKASNDGWVKEGTITVIKRKININSLYLSVYEKTYDKTVDAIVNAQSGFINWGANFIESDKFIPTIKGQFLSVSAGEKRVVISFIIPDDERNLNSKYEISDIEVIASPILKRNVSLVFNKTTYEISYGSNLPEIDFVLSGCIQQDMAHMREIFISSLNLNGATNSSNAGSYAISFDNQYKNEFPDYNFIIPSTAVIKINRIILPDIEFENKSFVYNGTNYEPSAKIGGKSIGVFAQDNPHLDLTYNFEDSYNNRYKNAGSYVIKLTVNVNGLASLNYTFSKLGYDESTISRSATYSISKIPLLITADDAIMIKGFNPPNLGYSISGFIDGENENNVTITGLGNLKLNCSATSKSSIGSYPITLSGSVSAINYEIVFKNGSLMVIESDISTEKNGVIVQGLQVGVEYNAEKLLVSSPEFVQLVSNISDRQQLVVLYKVEFKQDEIDYVSDSNVVMRLKIPEEFRGVKGIGVYRVIDNELQWVDSTIIGNYVVVNTKEGGDFIIVCDNILDKSFNYKLMIYIVVGVVLITAIMITFIVLRYKRA